MPTSSGESLEPHLVVSGLAAGYAGSRVIEDLDLVVNREEIVSIVGPNGAGKSTLLKALIGEIRPMAGSIELAGRQLVGLRTDQICSGGVGYVPQVRSIFPRLTVRENLDMGGYTMPRAEVNPRIEEVVDIFPALRPLMDRQAGNLSGGERKMLSMGRVMMTRPALMILDEPTAGLAPKIADQVLREQIASIAKTGVSLLVVEQRAKEALAISHRAYVLAGGRVVLSDRADALLARPDIGEIFLGRQVELTT